MNIRDSEGPVRAVLFLFSFTATLILLLIILFLFNEGIPLFSKVNPIDFFFGTEWRPTKDLYGAFPFIFFSLAVTAGALIIAVPLGVSCAIFLAELAPKWARDITRPVIELLAGIPSIIYGLFGLVVLVSFLKMSFNLATGETILAGSIILAIMILPIIISVSQDSIEAVPKSFKLGSHAMGATDWQTIRNVTLPAALPGILASIILGTGRAIGETMAVVLVLGNSEALPDILSGEFLKNISNVLLRPGEALTSAILLEMGPAEVGGTLYSALFSLGIILFSITFILSVISNYILSKSQVQLK